MTPALAGQIDSVGAAPLREATLRHQHSDQPLAFEAVLMQSVNAGMDRDELDVVKPSMSVDRPEGAPRSQSHQEKAYEAAQQLVAVAFVQPMLAQMREDPFRTDLFHGGRTEDVFQQQLDTTLSDRMVKSARQGGAMESPRMPIVDAVYRKLTGQTPPARRLLAGLRA